MHSNCNLNSSITTGSLKIGFEKKHIRISINKTPTMQDTIQINIDRYLRKFCFSISLQLSCQFHMSPIISIALPSKIEVKHFETMLKSFLECWILYHHCVVYCCHWWFLLSGSRWCWNEHLHHIQNLTATCQKAEHTVEFQYAFQHLGIWLSVVAV